MRWRDYALAIGLLVLPTLTSAVEPRTHPTRGIQLFLGLDDTSAPTQVADGRAQDLQNVVLDFDGSLTQREGVSLIVTPSNSVGLRAIDTLDIPDEDFCAVTGLYYTKFSSGTEKIVATCSDRFYELTGTTSWDIPADHVTLTGGDDIQFVWTVALDNIIGTNDTDTPIQFDGTSLNHVSFGTLSSDEVPTKSKTVVFFKNYLIFGNTVENSLERPTRFRYSNVGTINAWTDDDFIDISALGGQEINAFAELYDNLYVFLTDSIYRISLVGGDDVFQVSKVTDDIGCIAKNSVQSVILRNAQNGLIFLDKDKKIYFFNGVIAQDISLLITKTMDALSGSRLQFAVSADTNSDYLLCVTSGTGSTNNVCLDFQYEIGEWTKQQNIPANAMAQVIDNNTISKTYWGSYKSFVYDFADSDLRDDVGIRSGTVEVINTFTTATTSGLNIYYDASNLVTTGSLVGAPIRITGGTGLNQTNTIADNTETGLVMTDAFSTELDATSTYQVGAIDSFYTTKWYDMGESARLKHFGEIYFWAESDVSSTHTLSYATDFNADVETLSIALSASTADAIWGSAIWGVALWGSVDDVFRQAKLQAQGRYLRLKWAEADPDQLFRLYGWVSVHWTGDIN